MNENCFHARQPGLKARLVLAVPARELAEFLDKLEPVENAGADITVGAFDRTDRAWRQLVAPSRRNMAIIRITAPLALILAAREAIYRPLAVAA